LGGDKEEGRREGGGGEVEDRARDIGVAEAGVASGEEGGEVAVGSEAGDDGERMREAEVASGVGKEEEVMAAARDSLGLVPERHGAHLASFVLFRFLLLCRFPCFFDWTHEFRPIGTRN
jgi:cell wall-associated NlpC family hydrolase